MIALCGPPEKVSKSVSAPMKQNVSPSAIHSMLMIRRLSCDIAPNPEMTDLVGMMWAIPQTMIEIDPVYKSIIAMLDIFWPLAVK